jgi:hypothetical protein
VEPSGKLEGSRNPASDSARQRAKLIEDGHGDSREFIADSHKFNRDSRKSIGDSSDFLER